MMSLRNPNTVIGVVGGAASGKDTVADAFTRFGYEHVSSSDSVREEILARGKQPSRPLQTEIANEMRATEGSSYWVKQSLRDVREGQLVVISGLYAPGEGEFIQKCIRGLIVGVVASLDAESDLNARFHRLIDRADGSRDQLDYNAFLAAHQRENSGTSSGETNIGQLLGRADFTIVNNGPLADIHHQVENIVNEIRRV